MYCSICVSRTYVTASHDDEDAVLLDSDGARCGACMEQFDSAGPRVVVGPETAGPRVGFRVVNADLVE